MTSDGEDREAAALANEFLRVARDHQLGVIARALGVAAGEIASAACVDPREMLAAVAGGLFSIGPGAPSGPWQ
jgi:hypothetical protein